MTVMPCSENGRYFRIKYGTRIPIMTRADRNFFLDDAVTVAGRLPGMAIVAGPMIGIAYAGEPWVSMPWRFVIKNQKEKR